MQNPDYAALEGDETLRLAQQPRRTDGLDNWLEIDLARDEAPRAVARSRVDEAGYVVTVRLKWEWAHTCSTPVMA